MPRLLATACIFLILTENLANAQTYGPDMPDSLSVQGVLTDELGVLVPDGNYNILFKLYKGSTSVWQQNHTNVPVANGVFNVILGGSGAAALDTVAFNVPIELGITVNGDGEIAPRTPLTGAAFAMGVRGFHAILSEAGGGLSRSVNIISGAPNNFVASNAVGATLGGGGGFIQGPTATTIAIPNSITDSWGTVAGGFSNEAGYRASVSGGSNNTATNDGAAVGGGTSNDATGDYSVIAGGSVNNASSGNAAVGGGNGNTASGQWSTVPGGLTNVAGGAASFAAGIGAQANHDNSFVWNTSQGSPLATTEAEQFLIRAGGGVGVNTSTTQQDWNLDDGDGDGDVISRFHKSASGSDMVLGIHGNNYGLISVQSDDDLVFRTDLTERMRLSAGGNLSIGTVSCAARVCIENDGAVLGDYALEVTRTQGMGPALAVSKTNGGAAVWIGQSGGGPAVIIAQDGNITTTGNLSKGSGSFKIDHPLDPQNKFLYHSFVESPDMKNVYDGTVVLDGSGKAVVELPAYFEALNADFRYQLTPIGAPAPSLHIADRISNNRFRIAGGEPGMEVSWMVTGIRIDPFADQNRIAVEVEKPPAERGSYLHPDAYGASN